MSNTTLFTASLLSPRSPASTPVFWNWVILSLTPVSLLSPTPACGFVSFLFLLARLELLDKCLASYHYNFFFFFTVFSCESFISGLFFILALLGEGLIVQTHHFSWEGQDLQKQPGVGLSLGWARGPGPRWGCWRLGGHLSLSSLL